MNHQDRAGPRNQEKPRLLDAERQHSPSDTAKREVFPQVEPLAYRVPEAARALGIGKTTLYELFKQGALTPIRIGGRTLVPAGQLRRLVAEAGTPIKATQ